MMSYFTLLEHEVTVNDIRVAKYIPILRVNDVGVKSHVQINK